MGYMDERGYTKIVDRKKDMILVSGFNVYPNEIEEVAMEHPGIREAAAIGVPNDNSGETVKLFIVRKDPALTEEAVKAFCAERLTNYKRPRSVEFREDYRKAMSARYCAGNCGTRTDRGGSDPSPPTRRSDWLADVDAVAVRIFENEGPQPIMS